MAHSGSPTGKRDSASTRPFTSYAQNFEDVILWRALKHVKEGFYIDIGAQDPVTDSVSLSFYEHGWRGVHVEPVPAYAEKLRVARPGEVVVEAVIDRQAGRKTFHMIPDSGLSTGESANAASHAAEGLVSECVTVASLPLSTILDQWKQKDVHWLKIDVEGMEGAVINSWLPSRVRPWIVVVESTLPTSSEQNYETWEPNLLTLGYKFVYFDGLNRFYVSREHPEIEHHFGPGPNVFDGFVLSGLASAPFCSTLVAELNNARTVLTEQAAALKSHQAASAKNAQLIDSQSERIVIMQKEIDLYRQSLEWKLLTRILIAILSVQSSAREARRRMTRSVRAAVGSAARRLTNSSRLRRIARKSLRPFPGVTRRIRPLITRASAQTPRLPRRPVISPPVGPPSSEQADLAAALLASASHWKARRQLNV